MSALSETGRRASRNKWVRIGARVGLAARGVVWALMGVLALVIAFSNTKRQADTQGALAAIAAQSGGQILLVLIVIGLACYALWRLSQAILGQVSGDNDVKDRVTNGIRAVMYSILCFTAITVLTGSTGSSQDRQQKGYTARLMAHDGGRWLVAAVGLVVIGVGCYFVWQGVRRDVFEHFDPNDVPDSLRTPVVVLGVVGNTARGLVIALTGVLIVVAAATADPKKSSGLDGALRTVAGEPYGPWLIGLAGIGLLCFGAFACAEGIWSKV